MRTRSDYLPPREQQIIDLLNQRGELTAREIGDLLPEELSNSSIRTFLRSLEAKGRVTHSESDGRFVFRPTAPVEHSGRDELNRVVSTFFRGSVAATVTALLGPSDHALDREELEKIRQLIDAAQKDAQP